MSNEALSILMILGAFGSAIVAATKNRNAVGWFFAGALFPVIAALIILCVPALPTTEAPPTTT